MMDSATLEQDAVQAKPGPGTPNLNHIRESVLELIAGTGKLEPTLGTIASSVVEETGFSGCVIFWHCRKEEPLACVKSGNAIETAVSALASLAAKGLDHLEDGAGPTIAALELGEPACEPILGTDRTSLGIVIAFGHTERRCCDEMEHAHVVQMAGNAGFAILSELRARAFGEANERFAALAKNIPGVVYQRIVGADGNIAYSYISDAAEDLFGVSPAEILSDPQALFDCHGPEYYATFHNRLLEASKNLELWDVEATIFTRDGKRKFTHAIARPHKEPDGSVVWNGVILDQTRIKEAEMAAAAAEASTRDAIIESIPQAFALFDKNDQLVTWNSRFLKLYPELEGKLASGATYAELVKAEIDAGIDRVEEGGDPQAHYYQRLARHHQAAYEAERQVSGNRWILINEHRTAEGGTVVLHTDVTELKNREFALEQSNKELEAFASIASHDLQEPLRKIDAFGGRLKKRFSDELGDDGRMYIDRMQSSVARMRELINDLLDYSRVTTQGKPLALINLSDIAQDVIGDLQILIESTEGRVEVGELAQVQADRTQMRQLLQNIIANALKFHKPGEAPHVTIDFVTGGQGDVTAKPSLLRIQDNGIGFDMKYAERIFGIFQRLHGRSEYEGTGVGLATCRKIAERHGWSIRAESEPGKGTAFLIEIPPANQKTPENVR